MASVEGESTKEKYDPFLKSFHPKFSYEDLNESKTE